MSTIAKPFQQATVDAACRILLDASGPRRFLVADEVGLGKTLVAREIVRRFMEQTRRRKLVVFYIANGQRVASQNRRRLVDFLPQQFRDAAVSRADRIGLIPMVEQPKTPLVVYALSPETSFPSSRKSLSLGRKEERAYISAILLRAYPELDSRKIQTALKGQVKVGWRALVKNQRAIVAGAPERFVQAFRRALRVEFDGDPRATLKDLKQSPSLRALVGRLRRALAHTALLSEPPDLIIFDEFQRYREMLFVRSRTDRLVAAMFSGRPDRSPPAALLLSATPYKPFASRWEESRGVDAHRELFDLVEFLSGDEGPRARAAAESAFGAFGRHLRSIAMAADDDGLANAVQSAQECRDTIHQLLAPLMSRTEREVGQNGGGGQTIPLPAELDPEDVYVYRNLATAFQRRHRSDALPYWLSVPLPAQALGKRYQAWRHARKARDGALVKITHTIRSRLDPPPNWPHPKLRALNAVTPVENLALPWVAPSLEWWPLAGPWATASGSPKLLLFSRFKATPQSIAALTSFGVEAAHLRNDPAGYAGVWRRRKLQPGPGRMPTLALFHPSPFLIRAVDPLQAGAKTLRGVRNAARRQLLSALKEIDIEVRDTTAKERERRRPTWSLIAEFERRAGQATFVKNGWAGLSRKDQRLGAMVQTWRGVRAVWWISPRELDDLVEAALAFPGNATGRALLRHFPDALEVPHYANLVRLCWSGLRRYLDNPVFWAVLKDHSPVEAVQRAVLEGGFEALLDEHFWVLKQGSSEGGADIAAAMQSALSVVTGSFSFHPVGPKAEQRIRIRCHAAVPFGGTDDVLGSLDANDGQPARSEDLRVAFNAPFWPHVLATTSVGQEGLDFHTWCARVAHWDLCSSPLDLEQREGRIQRFGGLLIRKRLAQQLGPGILSRRRPRLRSAWDDIAALAEESHSDPAGLSPWWLLPDAGVTRYVFELPQGRDTERLARLREQRFIYRLALGQPNQEDMIDLLSALPRERLDILSSLALDLSAFARGQDSEPQEDPPSEVDLGARLFEHAMCQQSGSGEQA